MRTPEDEDWAKFQFMYLFFFMMFLAAVIGIIKLFTR